MNAVALVNTEHAALGAFCALSQETDLSDGSLSRLADEISAEYDVQPTELLEAFDLVPAGVYSRLVVQARAAGAGGLA